MVCGYVRTWLAWLHADMKDLVVDFGLASADDEVFNVSVLAYLISREYIWDRISEWKLP